MSKNLFSVILPAYNSSAFISKALTSIFSGFDKTLGWDLEVLVVDDGGSDKETLIEVCSAFDGVRILHHSENKGMCAARNTGFSEVKGVYATLLDSDDEFLPAWFASFQEILKEWPDDVQVCLTPCINQDGKRTCSRPDYKGLETAEDLVLERYSGEYNPIFRGSYIRSRGYINLGTRKSCGGITYLTMVREAPFWITDKVQRLYNDPSEQSVTFGWTKPEKAKETHLCFSKILEVHGDFIKAVSMAKYKQIVCKMLIYRMMAGLGRDWVLLLRQFSLTGFKAWLATFVLFALGNKGTAFVLLSAKRLGFLRKYG